MKTEQQKLHNWFSVNRLSINVAKINYMWFGNFCKKKTNMDIKVDNTILDRVHVSFKES